ncbi:hypothetical protein C8Q72DRAFT_803455 [Fomitopsis betulina]|nr:hypothetical protein C8Q72DRAFT_803455 [Fomitopsis betulina]
MRNQAMLPTLLLVPAWYNITALCVIKPYRKYRAMLSGKWNVLFARTSMISLRLLPSRLRHEHRPKSGTCRIENK